VKAKAPPEPVVWLATCVPLPATQRYSFTVSPDRPALLAASITVPLMNGSGSPLGGPGSPEAAAHGSPLAIAAPPSDAGEPA
jgi:hypothetical protein